MGTDVCVCFVGGSMDGKTITICEDSKCPLTNYYVPIYAPGSVPGKDIISYHSEKYRRQDEHTFVLDMIM